MHMTCIVIITTLLLSCIRPAFCFWPVLPSNSASTRSTSSRRTLNGTSGGDPSLQASYPSLQATMSLTSAAVEKAMAAAEHEAKTNGWKVTIAICDAGGMPLLAKRMDGAFPASFDIAVGKAKTAAHFCRPTGQLESAANVSDGSSRTALLSAPYVIMRGGLPIFINGICCGAVGVSGVKPNEDEQIASVALSTLDSIASSRL